MILIIDNYDSFTFNLVHYVEENGFKTIVFRNDQISLKKIKILNPKKIIISPGPCTPREAGLSIEVIKHFAGKLPIMGVCLGHQCIGHAFGGEVVVNYRMMHGKTSPITHNGKDLFKGIPSPYVTTRYHSLIVKRDTLPDCLAVTAETSEGEIMGLQHREFPIWGVQFHPESILTEHGHTMMQNFLNLSIENIG